jgi:uncharacterized protein with NAD-binding domain and iron-sulfur cluster
MSPQIVILGGGIGGLSAAQELAERGFQVALYEKRNTFGGKARSVSVPNTGTEARKDLPGEHGFRFFPSFYKHVTDTMKRIPYDTNAHGVFDNLVQATRTQLSRVGRFEVTLPDSFPQSIDDWVTALRALFTPDLGISDEEILFFIDRLLVLLTSCEERRLAEYEKITWWDFVDATHKSTAYQRLLAQGQTRSLVAMRAELGSTRTVGYILLQLYLGALNFGGSFDRLLNGPTTEVWIDPWVDHLKRLGVEMHSGLAMKAFHLEGGRISKVTLEQGGQSIDVHADFYIAALPVEIMATLLTDELKAGASSMANLGSLKTAWMNGIQFYLANDVPVVHGHSLYVDSPWALTSVSQKQFWQGVDLGQYGDGRVRGILSVCISDWETPGILYGKPAVRCSAEEIKSEVWAQIKAPLDAAGSQELEDSNLLLWFLDPDIQFGPPQVTNLEPLLINMVGSLQYRPEAKTELANLFLASDYVRTYTDIATMEAANEAARRAVNAILDATSSGAPRAQIWPLQEPELFKPMLEYDRLRFKLGLSHSKLM